MTQLRYTMSARPDEWDAIVQLVRSYALRKYGGIVDGITLHILNTRREHFEPFPDPRTIPPRLEIGTCGSASQWATGDRPKYLTEFRAVYWPGLGRFVFTDMQSRVIAALWSAREEGLPGVEQRELLRAANSECTRLSDIFKRSPAWGTLILPGNRPGLYTLPPEPEPDPEQEESDPSAD